MAFEYMLGTRLMWLCDVIFHAEFSSVLRSAVGSSILEICKEM